VLKDDLHSKIFAMAFSMAAEIERELVSQRTKEAIARARAQGKRIGRPRGPGRSSLDAYYDQIKELLEKGVSITSIAKIIGKPYSTVYNFIQKRNLLKK